MTVMYQKLEFVLTIHTRKEIIVLTENDIERVYSFMNAWKAHPDAYRMRLTMNGRQIHLTRRKDTRTWENFRYNWNK